MTNNQPSILFLHTHKSLNTLEIFPSQKTDFEKILTEISNNGYPLERCSTIEEAKRLLKPHGQEFNIVLLHFDSSEGHDLWRDLFHAIRAHNKFSEVIVIDANSNKQDEEYVDTILSGGCFSYFQYHFNVDVLFGYIRAARSKYESRAYRANLSFELNKDLIDTTNTDGITVHGVINKIAEKIKDLTGSNNIIITLLKKGREEQGFLRKLVYSSNSIKRHEVTYFSKPTKQDILITQILEEKIERRIFPSPRKDEEIIGLFDPNHEIQVNSCVILPLRHAGVPIGLITVIDVDEGKFNYEKINELTLEQIANQVAATIRYAEKNEVLKRLDEALSALNNSKDLNEILEKLAEQACKLVGGLFSYIVVPDETQTYLEFRGAWSEHHENLFINDLKDRVRDGRFLIPNSGQTINKGITGLAFITSEKQLLENITDKNYQETSDEAKNAYFLIPYTLPNSNNVILTNSDIALPILLKSDNEFPSHKKTALGVINVEHIEPFAFTQEHISALAQLADFAAIAIENKAGQDFVSELYSLIDFPGKDDLSYSESFDNIQSFLSDIAVKMKNIC